MFTACVNVRLEALIVVKSFISIDNFQNNYTRHPFSLPIWFYAFWKHRCRVSSLVVKLTENDTEMMPDLLDRRKTGWDCVR